VTRFVKSCAETGSRKVCQCTIDQLQETLPFKEFDAADKAVRAEKPIPAKTRRLIDDATATCRE
jgi:hypothetical protein